MKHVRSCEHCGQEYESESAACAEIARDSHERSCKFKPE